jgi:hypothetical protein
MATATVGEMIEEALAHGFLQVGSVPDGRYLIEIVDVQVYAEAISPVYVVLRGTERGTRFQGFKMNFTQKGGRRAARILRAWGVMPRDASPEELADELSGRRAYVEVKNQDLYGTTFSVFDERTMRRVD